MSSTFKHISKYLVDVTVNLLDTCIIIDGKSCAEVFVFHR